MMWPALTVEIKGHLTMIEMNFPAALEAYLSNCPQRYIANPKILRMALKIDP